MRIGFGADRKEPHESAVAKQGEADKVGTRIACAEIDELSALVAWRRVSGAPIEEHRLFKARSLEREHALHKFGDRIHGLVSFVECSQHRRAGLLCDVLDANV